MCMAAVCFLLTRPEVLALTPPLTTITVTSLSSATIRYQVFNPATGITVSNTHNAQAGLNISGVSNPNNGILVWLESKTIGTPGFTASEVDVWMATWRPATGWDEAVQTHSIAGFGNAILELQNVGGAVCWVESVGSIAGGVQSKAVWYSTCDPRTGWIVSGSGLNFNGIGNIGLVTQSGIIAWRDLGTSNYRVGYAIYDPVSRAWDGRLATYSTIGNSIGQPTISSSAVF